MHLTKVRAETPPVLGLKARNRMTRKKKQDDPQPLLKKIQVPRKIKTTELGTQKGKKSSSRNRTREQTQNLVYIYSIQQDFGKLASGSCRKSFDIMAWGPSGLSPVSAIEVGCGN